MDYHSLQVLRLISLPFPEQVELNGPHTLTHVWQAFGSSTACFSSLAEIIIQ
jgi:hypothetical protein